MWHELAGLTGSESIGERDRAIRSWLSEKAKELSHGIPEKAIEAVRVLGLSEEPLMETKQEKWCPHISETGRLETAEHSTFIDKDWKACPVCLTPRPVEKSLAQLLFDVYWGDSDLKPSWDVFQGKSWYESMAECARKYFAEGNK